MQIRLRHLALPLTLFVAAPLAGCSKDESAKGGDDKPAATAKAGGDDAKAEKGALTKAQVEPLFPADFGGMKRKGFKLKEVGGGAVEYNATYKGEGKLKLIVNDQPPKGRDDWKDQVAKGGKKIGDYNAAAEKKGDKVTVMVHVAERFRVDFKSRDIPEEKLWEIAKQFNFDGLAKLGG